MFLMTQVLIHISDFIFIIMYLFRYLDICYVQHMKSQIH